MATFGSMLELKISSRRAASLTGFPGHGEQETGPASEQAQRREEGRDSGGAELAGVRGPGTHAGIHRAAGSGNLSGIPIGFLLGAEGKRTGQGASPAGQASAPGSS
jgi:hypothetical protein